MTRRWVRFETPIMVCVEVDDATEHAEVSKVVLAIEDHDIHLARDHRGHFLVYDEQMERCNDDLDRAAARAVSAADDRTTWPSGSNGDWDEGPDPLRFPELYDDGDTSADDEEPADLPHGSRIHR